MAKQSNDGNVAWFIAGLTVGFASALLLAPRSGEQTRKSLSDAVARSRDFAEDKRKKATEFGRELYDQGRELVDEIKLPRSGGAPADAPEESRPADESQG